MFSGVVKGSKTLNEKINMLRTVLGTICTGLILFTVIKYNTNFNCFRSEKLNTTRNETASHPQIYFLQNQNNTSSIKLPIMLVSKATIILNATTQQGGIWESRPEG